MYAVIETSGKQYRVSPGAVISVDLMEAEIGSTVTLDRVLLLSTDSGTVVGSPLVASAKAIGEVKSHGRGEKVCTLKKKRRKNYSRKIGHRQGVTMIEIKEVLD